MPEYIQTAFSAGEITNDVFGRVDIDWYRLALAECRNCFVRAHGGVSNRAGLRFVSEVFSSPRKSRLVEFQYSTLQTYGLEFGENILRVIKNKGLVLEPDKNITAITKANPAVITINSHGYSNGKKVFLKNIGGMTELNGRFFDVTVVDSNKISIGVDSTNYTTYTSGGKCGVVFQLATPYSEQEVQELKFVQSADVVYITHKNHKPKELTRSDHHVWTLSDMAFSPELSAPTGLTATVPDTGTPQKTYKYVVTAETEAGEESIASSEVSAVSKDMDQGGTISLSWNPVSGAVRYNIYKEQNGAGIHGWVGSSSNLTFIDDNMVGDMSNTPTTGARNPFDGSGKYPSVVSFYEQRSIFGATGDQPQTVFASRTGNYNNMGVSKPARDDDAITFTLASKQVNDIKHIFDLNDLILFTGGGEWRVHGGAEGDPITPSGINAKKQTGWGCNDVVPTLIGETVLFVQKEGKKVRALGYDLEKAGYKGNDLSIRVPHFFEDGATIVDMAYAQEPHSIVWCVLSNGDLLGFTYVEEQNVWAWHKHTTDGQFENVMVIDEGGYSVPYFVVKRYVNGSHKRYIEYLDNRDFQSVEDAFFVDSGLSYEGPAIDKVKGLDHLEGKKVSVLGDGNVQNQKTVVDGSINLDREVTKLHIGLPYLSHIKTLRPALNIPGGGQGKQKVLDDVSLRVKKTRGIKVGKDLNNLDSFEEIKAENLIPNEPLPLVTGDLTELIFENGYDDDGQFFVVQDYPLPMTILALIPSLEVGYK